MMHWHPMNVILFFFFPLTSVFQENIWISISMPKAHSSWLAVSASRSQSEGSEQQSKVCIPVWSP